MFYELKHDLSADYFTKESGEDFSFQAHMHHCFEMIVITEGEMRVNVDDREYRLTKGGALLIFPNQVHSMVTDTHSKHELCLFSQKHVSAYSEKVASKVPVDNYFVPDEFYIRQMEAVNDDTDHIELKGMLYAFCGSFHKNAVYREAASHTDKILYGIFEFIEQHYKQDCTLHSLAKALGYSESYLSRYFVGIVVVTYNEYVNHYRISHACYLLSDTDMPILEISYECGFNCLRSFNRNYKRHVGITPLEYRNNNKGKALVDKKRAMG